jgi:putative transcriptional regulator
MARKSLAEVRAKPFEFTEEERLALNSRSDEEIEAGVARDPDASPFRTDDELAVMDLARRVRRVRERLGLSQGEFARKFHINAGRLRDTEQARYKTVDSAFDAYVRVIEQAPDVVERALAAA